MSEIRELSFSELKQKDIVCIGDGRKLGRIIDLVFSPSGKVKGIVAPYGRKMLFIRSQEVYIPYSNIKTIGEDIILVDIESGFDRRSSRADCRMPPQQCDDEHNNSRCNRSHLEEDKQGSHDTPDCDGRCDKCMLFDCDSRWKKRGSVYIDNNPI